MEIDGILIIRKEGGLSSFDVIRRMRKILNTRKLGHTGTLDPMAEGVLPVFCGRATRFCSYLTGDDKEYVASFRLGVETDTYDITGTVLSHRDVRAEYKEIKAALLSFYGESVQTPPMYSAIKVNGKKLYELARKGEEVERKARKIDISEIEILSYDEAAYELRARIVCSKGTYIRSIAHDLGEKLLCGATLSALTRTRAGRFVIKDAVTLDALFAMDEDEIRGRLMPPDTLFRELPKLILAGEHERRARNGALIYCDGIPGFFPDAQGRYRAYGETGQFLMLLKTVEVSPSRFALLCEKNYA